MTYKEIIKTCQKKEYETQSEGWNFFGMLIREMSYPVTYLFIKTPITPNQVSFISLLCTVIGFVVMTIWHNNFIIKLIGILLFFIWNVLDCVDGNIARCKKQFSENGDLWDAAAGYAALFLMFISMGICSSESIKYYHMFIVLGCLSGAFTLYPRLLMHFKYHGESNEINNQNEYGIIKRIVFNVISPDALVQPFMVIAVLFGIEYLFTIGYFILNGMVCLFTCYQLFRHK